MDIIITNSDKPWDWERLSENPNIIWNITQPIPDKPWNWKLLSWNPSITWDIVKSNPHRPWNWYWLIRNLSITMDIIMANSNKEHCNWYWLSSNPNITMDIVTTNLDKPWEWDELSRNPNITVDIIRANPDKPWNWYYLSRNEFKYNSELNEIHLKKLRKIRNKIKSFIKIKKWYKLYLLTKTQKFWKWYCGPDGIGRKIDHKRILECDAFQRDIRTVRSSIP